MTEKPKKILLVEDDSAIADIYETIFQKGGFEVEKVESGREAIKKITKKDSGEKTNPDIVLLDLILPDINGIEVLKKIKEGAETKDIPVFVLTNQKDEQTEKLDNIKPDQYIIKANITPTQLLELIKERLK